MRRGYIRERKSGPTPDEQRKSLAASGINMTFDHPAVYVDLLNKAGKSGPLGERANAIKSLRQGDELVVHDAATLGRTSEDINRAMIEIGRRGGTLIVWTPEARPYTWDQHASEVAGEISSLAADAATVLLSEKHQRASTKNIRLGAQPKLVGTVREIALKHWRNPALTAKQAHAAAMAETGVRFSLRLMQMPEDNGGLGKKMDAEVVIDLPRPAPLTTSKPKRKPKPKSKRRKTIKRPAKG